MNARFAGADAPWARYADADKESIAEAREHVAAGRIYLDEQVLQQPLHWKRGRRIFVGSMTDIAGEWVPSDWLMKILAVAALTPQHTYLLLTKRPNRLKRAFDGEQANPHAVTSAMYYLTTDHELCAVMKDSRTGMAFWPLPNVWLGVTVEEDRFAWRAKVLTEIPAAVRFVSAEPLLGPLPSLQLATSCHCLGTGPSAIYCQDCRVNGVASGKRRVVDWLITGGESGPSARPMHPDWARELRDRCQAAGVAYFHKQNGEWAPVYEGGIERSEGAGSLGAVWEDGRWHIFRRGERHGHVFRLGKKAAGRLLDGRSWDEHPEALSVALRGGVAVGTGAFPPSGVPAR
jgi:protein gp37